MTKSKLDRSNSKNLNSNKKIKLGLLNKLSLSKLNLDIKKNSKENSKIVDQCKNEMINMMDDSYSNNISDEEIESSQDNSIRFNRELTIPELAYTENNSYNLKNTNYKNNQNHNMDAPIIDGLTIKNPVTHQNNKNTKNKKINNNCAKNYVAQSVVYNPNTNMDKFENNKFNNNNLLSKEEKFKRKIDEGYYTESVSQDKNSYDKFKMEYMEVRLNNNKNNGKLEILNDNIKKSNNPKNNLMNSNNQNLNLIGKSNQTSKCDLEFKAKNSCEVFDSKFIHFVSDNYNNIMNRKANQKPFSRKYLTHIEELYAENTVSSKPYNESKCSLVRYLSSTMRLFSSQIQHSRAIYVSQSCKDINSKFYFQNLKHRKSSLLAKKRRYSYQETLNFNLNLS